MFQAIDDEHEDRSQDDSGSAQPSEQPVLSHTKAVECADYLVHWLESLGDADPIAVLQQRNILRKAKLNVAASEKQKKISNYFI